MKTKTFTCSHLDCWEKIKIPVEEPKRFVTLLTRSGWHVRFGIKNRKRFFSFCSKHESDLILPMKHNLKGCILK